MHESIAHSLLALYSEVATLKLLPRTGWLQRGVANAESVAEHSFGLLVLTLFIGDTIADLDRGKLLAIALLHDMAEVYLSDLPASARRFLGGHSKHEAEQRALQELFAKHPRQADYLALWSEYVEGSSAEARLVKGLDRIELLAQALIYEQAGQRTLTEFWAGADTGWSEEFPVLRSMAAQLLASHHRS